MKISTRDQVYTLMGTIRNSAPSDDVGSIEQISHLIYLKLLDVSSFPSDAAPQPAQPGDPGLFSYTADRYRWRNWSKVDAATLPSFIRDEVFPYMASVVLEDRQVAAYFKDASFEVEEPNILRKLIEQIEAFELDQLSVESRGELFEWILRWLERSARRPGFRTPQWIRTLMIAAVDPELGENIYDPVCGTGGLLVDAHEYSAKKLGAPYRTAIRSATGQFLTGSDVSRQMIRLATLNLLMHDIPNANLTRANSLSEINSHGSEDSPEQYNVILADLPIGGTVTKELVRKDLQIRTRKTDLLFLALAMHSLQPGGRCAILLPESVLFATTQSHRDLREELVRSYEVRAVVSLPAGAFAPQHGVKTSILVFQKPTPRVRIAKDVCFYEFAEPAARLDEKTLEKQRTAEVARFLHFWKEYKSVDFAPPSSLSFEEHVSAVEGVSWWADSLTLSKNDYILSARTYQPESYDATAVGDPATIVREILKTESEIATELRTLLADFENNE